MLLSRTRPAAALSHFVLPALFGLLASACGEPSTPAEDSGPTAPIDAGADASSPADAGDPTLVAIEHTRELRGAWVPSVWNLAFPSRTGLTRAETEAEITTMLDRLADMRANAAFVQIRPESDALYASELEPWSRYLTGTQGGDPGFDPLAMWIEHAHARGIEVHAWLNPYRGMASAAPARADDHVSRRLAQYAYTLNNVIYMDPGAPAVRAHIVAVVRDVVSRYDVDGIHFDDYFYPYPAAGGPAAFPDDATYAAYTSGGGTLDRDDWRRQNVHDLIRDVSQAIAEARDDVRFGVSPFGIWRSGVPEGIRGLDAYSEIYCDALPWLENGWVDYVAPQLYWPTTRAQQDFDVLIDWWAAQARAHGRTVYAGYALYHLGSSAEWTVDEFRREMAAVASHAGSGVAGSIAYHVKPFVSNTEGIADVFRDEVWTAPAATPALADADLAARPAPPTLTAEGGSLRIEHPERDALRSFVVYQRSGPSVVRIVPASTTTVDLGDLGDLAITALDRRGVESLARLVP